MRAPSLGWQEPVCSLLGAAGGGSLPAAEPARGESAPPQSIGVRDRQQWFKCRILQAFPSFQNFWFLLGERWSCLTGRGGSLEPGGRKVVGGKVKLTSWAVTCGCCSLAGLSLEGSPEHSPLPGSGTHSRHTTLQPCNCWLCLQGSARSRRESSPLSHGTVSGATAGSS